MTCKFSRFFQYSQNLMNYEVSKQWLELSEEGVPRLSSIVSAIDTLPLRCQHTVARLNEWLLTVMQCMYKHFVHDRSLA